MSEPISSLRPATVQAMDEATRALVALDAITESRRRRPLMAWELRSIAKEYVAGKKTIAQMAEDLKRPERTIVDMVRLLRLKNRCPRNSGSPVELQRRNAKIIEALHCGDSRESICRRWEISEKILYSVASEYRDRMMLPLEKWRRLWGDKRLRKSEEKPGNPCLSTQLRVENSGGPDAVNIADRPNR